MAVLGSLAPGLELQEQRELLSCLLRLMCGLPPWTLPTGAFESPGLPSCKGSGHVAARPVPVPGTLRCPVGQHSAVIASASAAAAAPPEVLFYAINFALSCTCPQIMSSL